MLTFETTSFTTSKDDAFALSDDLECEVGFDLPEEVEITVLQPLIGGEPKALPAIRFFEGKCLTTHAVDILEAADAIGAYAEGKETALSRVSAVEEMFVILRKNGPCGGADYIKEREARKHLKERALAKSRSEDFEAPIISTSMEVDLVINHHSLTLHRTERNFTTPQFVDSTEKYLSTFYQRMLDKHNLAIEEAEATAA